MDIPANWTKVHLLITNKPDEGHPIGQLFTFYQDLDDGCYFQTPEYVDYIIRNLGFGTLQKVEYAGKMVPIEFVPVTIDSLEWCILNPL